MDSAPFSSATVFTASTATSTVTNTNVNNDALYAKCYIALAGLNKSKT